MTTLTRTPIVRRGSRAAPAAGRERVEVKPGEADEVVSTVSSVFSMVALVCAWFLLQVLVLGGLSQARDQHLLYAEFRTQVAQATAPLGPVIPPGDPVAVLSIPKLDLQQVVVEGTASGDLLAGPGHRRDTVLPGQAGTSVVYGRASTYGSPFGKLDQLEIGDKILAQTGQAKTEFTVEALRREGDPVSPPPAGTARLTLVTAVGHGTLEALRPSRTLFVDASSPKAQPVPGGRPTAVPTSELAMADDPGALPTLALGLGLLAVLTGAVLAARQRWSAALVWVIASPVAITLFWFTTDQVMRLLPNLM